MPNKFYLAVEVQNNSYSLINTSDLETCDTDYEQLDYLDGFTSNYKKETLAELIYKANIVPNTSKEELIDKICIVYPETVKNKIKYRNLPVMTQEKASYDIADYLNFITDDKEKINIVYNYLGKYSVLDNTDYRLFIKMALNSHDINRLMEFINSLEYLDQRKIYFYIVENLITEDKKYINDQKSKKLYLAA